MWGFLFLQKTVEIENCRNTENFYAYGSKQDLSLINYML